MSDPTAVTPSTAVRMEPGELREPIAAFITHLTRLGYTRLTARGYEDSARHFGEWLARSGMTIADVNDGVRARSLPTAVVVVTELNFCIGTSRVFASITKCCSAVAFLGRRRPTASFG